MRIRSWVARAHRSSPLGALTSQQPRLPCLVATDDDAAVVDALEISVLWRDDVGTASRCTLYYHSTSA